MKFINKKEIWMQKLKRAASSEFSNPGFLRDCSMKNYLWLRFFFLDGGLPLFLLLFLFPFLRLLPGNMESTVVNLKILK